MNVHETRWIEPEPVEIPLELSSKLREPDIVLEALIRRGYSTFGQAQSFIDPSFYKPTDPSELPDLDIAADLIVAAIAAGRKIAVWGDFDVDGQTSTAIFVQTLTHLNANYTYHVPIRAQESHGVNLPALKELISQGTELILTCDTGITAHEAVNYANQLHIPFIITDHHTLPKTLPEAQAVVNPQRLAINHPFHPLCGAGTAYQLASELLQRAGQSEMASNLLDLVALGTVADLAQLTGDNRYLVQTGLQQLRNSPRLALKAMLLHATVNYLQVNEEHLGYIIAPRMNALGRLGDANAIIPFLLSNDENEINPMIGKLETLNTRRKLLCDQVFQGALEQIKQDSSLLDEDVLVLSHSSWSAGVIGIVASRLVELYHRPAILISAESSGIAKASARSIEGINIIQAISQSSEMLLGFGGHPMAAGFSLPTDRVLDFRKAITRIIRQLTTETPPQLDLRIDRFVSLNEVTLDLVQAIDRLAPFGLGNASLTLACRDVMITNTTPIGKSREHLQVMVEDRSAAAYKFLWWQGAGLPLPEERFDLAFSARAVNYRGQLSPQLEWISAKKHEKSKIEISQRFSILDHRFSDNPYQQIAPMIDQPDTIVWCEGENPSEIVGSDRFSLHHASRLVIWNTPPGQSELRAILRAVNPIQVIIFGINSSSDQLPSFLKHIAGLVQFSLKHYAGIVSIQKLASATSQRETTILKGLLWMVARGLIQIEDRSENILKLSLNGTKDLKVEKCLENDINQLLVETNAYRNYFRRAEANHLLEE